MSARIAVYSVALRDLFNRTAELEVSEEDEGAIEKSSLMELAALSFSQATRYYLYATKVRHVAALGALELLSVFIKKKKKKRSLRGSPERVPSSLIQVFSHCRRLGPSNLEESEGSGSSGVFTKSLHFS